MNVVRRILVPVDFSPCSRAAVEFAVAFAEGLKAGVEVLHVWEPLGNVGPDSIAVAAMPSRSWDQTRDAMRRELDTFLGTLRGSLRQIRVEPGIPSDVIAEVARAGEFDLIMMGTHGRGGIKRLLVGSVAEAVMRKAPVPVLTVKVPCRSPRECVML